MSVSKPYLLIIIALLLMQVLVIARNGESRYFSFFWYCDFIPIVLAAAFLRSNVQAIKGILNVGLFAQVLYIVVISSKLVFGVSLLGFIFNFPLTLPYVLPTIIIHLSTLLAFIAVFKIKPAIEALSYSFLLLVCMYVLITTLVIPDSNNGNNYNFIFYSSNFPTFRYYTEMWVPLTFISVVVPTYLFQYLVYWLYTKRSQGKREARGQEYSMFRTL